MHSVIESIWQYFGFFQSWYDDSMDRKTLQYYENNAQNFINRTLPIDFTPLQQKFLSYLKPGSRILDFGCGSGRDALAFRKQGYACEAIDGTKAFIDALHAQGIPARCMLFSEFSDQERYDAIWACASLLHLSDAEMQETLLRIYSALKPGGIFYCSVKKGEYHGERDGRWFHDYLPATLYPVLKAAGFDVLELFESQDARPDYKEKPWVNAICQKPKTIR